VCIFVTSCVLFYYVCIAVLHTSVAGLLARSQYTEGRVTGHLGTGFSWFPCVYKQMLRWFPGLQVATACFSCSPPNLNFLDPCFIIMYMHNNHCHRVTAHLQLNILLLLLSSSLLLCDWPYIQKTLFLPSITQNTPSEPSRLQVTPS